MGWDAYAKTRLRREFIIAADLVKYKTGIVDCLLSKGGLDCSICGRFLAEATNKSQYTDWTKEEVLEAFKNAKWPRIKDIPKDDRWAMESAKEFLRVCVYYQCGITFTY